MSDAGREKCESVLTLSCISVLCIFAAFCVLTLASGEGGGSGVEKCSEMKIVCFKGGIPPGNYLDRIEEINCVLVDARYLGELKSQSLNSIECIEDVHIVRALFTPNDSIFDEQWNLMRIHAPEAWDVERGSENVTIAIIDTGIDFAHEDLAEKAENYAFGYDFLENDTVPDDENGHGTAVAGVASAVLNNGKGITGIAQVKIMALKVLNASGFGTDWDVARAITFAAENGADVISMSLGSDNYSEDMRRACERAYEKGCVLVAAAGNENSSVLFPAAYDCVIAVGAIDESNKKTNYSNFGEKLELVAPGNSIPATYPDDRYVYFTGTSAATPHVSAVAALLKSANPALSNAEIRRILCETAEDLGEAGRDPFYGFGLLNASAAISAVLQRREFDIKPRNPYPSIAGTFYGKIVPSYDIKVSKISIYPCVGTGGHAEFVSICNETKCVNASWSGYSGDWRNISLNFTLIAGETYNITIKTGSYPQILHKQSAEVEGGKIICVKYEDVNGRNHNDWIPAFKLE